MVIENNFEFKVVSATETKTPFKEHQKGGKTYLEVEPDAEYYLSVRKLNNDGRIHYCRFFIDGQDLGYHQTYQEVTAVSKKLGLFSVSNGTCTNTALKFVKASFMNNNNTANHAHHGSSSMSGMGTITMQVFEAISTGQSQCYDFTTSFFTSSIEKGHDSVAMKKHIRSGKGCNAESYPFNNNIYHEKYAEGPHLFTATIYYCATPGLIAVGILPKPPLWDYHRMMKPAAKRNNGDAEDTKNYIVSVKKNRRGNDIIVLAD